MPTCIRSSLYTNTCLKVPKVSVIGHKSIYIFLHLFVIHITAVEPGKCAFLSLNNALQTCRIGKFRIKTNEFHPGDFLSRAFDNIKDDVSLTWFVAFKNSDVDHWVAVLLV